MGHQLIRAPVDAEGPWELLLDGALQLPLGLA